MSRIVRNGVLIYESRRGQFGHLSYEQFKRELKKEHRAINLLKKEDSDNAKEKRSKKRKLR